MPKAEVATIPQPSGVPDLLRLAVERGTPVAELKELVALHEQMRQAEAARSFATAMAAFQHECPSIKKSSKAEITTSKGGKYSYTYAELDEIARTINPILAKHGLSYSWDSDIAKDSILCICTIRHADGHSISAKLTIPVENASAATPQQKVGGALTYAQRRTLSAALGLTTTDEDTDGGGAAADPTPISEDQVLVLTDLLAESKASPERFLKWIGAASVAAICAVDYDRAVAALRRKVAS